jgi:hypothetical protein
MDATEMYFFANGPRDRFPAIGLPFVALDRDTVCDWNWAMASQLSLSPFRHVAPFEKVRRGCSISDQSDVVETDVGAVATNPEIV